MSYGVTADNPAFEQLFRRSTWWRAAAAPFVADHQPGELAHPRGARRGDGGWRARQASLPARCQRAATAQSDYQRTSPHPQISDINDVDVAAVTAKVSDYTAQLQASYSALSKIQGLNLVDYLR